MLTKNKEGKMNLEVITKEDLKEFKNEMLSEIKQLMQPGQGQSKQWLKSVEVRKLLKISPGTLQNLRINGTLRFTRIGSIMYYKQEDINKLLEGGLQ
jgi:propanediol utilization protein